MLTEYDELYKAFQKENLWADFEKINQSSHFAPFLVHESFHYYMQNNWKQYNRSYSSKESLISYAKQYVDVVSKRIENNEQIRREIDKSHLDSNDSEMRYLN